MVFSLGKDPKQQFILLSLEGGSLWSSYCVNCLPLKALLATYINWNQRYLNVLAKLEEGQKKKKKNDWLFSNKICNNVSQCWAKISTTKYLESSYEYFLVVAGPRLIFVNYNYFLQLQLGFADRSTTRCNYKTININIDYYDCINFKKD